MPGKGRKVRERWRLTVVQDGSPAEAEATASLAHRLVAEWIIRVGGAGAARAEHGAGVGPGAGPA